MNIEVGDKRYAFVDENGRPLEGTALRDLILGEVCIVKFVLRSDGAQQITCILFPLRDTDHSSVARSNGCTRDNFVGAGEIGLSYNRSAVEQVEYGSMTCHNHFGRDAPQEGGDAYLTELEIAVANLLRDV